MTVKGRQGTVPMLGVGSGPQRLLIDGSAAAGATPRITQACLVMDGFDPDQVQQALSQFGVKPRGDATGAPGPMVSWVRMRSEELGGAEGDTPELFFTDPDGIVIQLAGSAVLLAGSRLEYLAPFWPLILSDYGVLIALHLGLANTLLTVNNH